MVKRQKGVSLVELLRQDVLIVSRRCNIKCLFCPLWQDETLNTVEYHRYILDKKRKGELLKRFRGKYLINVIGGDPFCHPRLPSLLRHLKENGKKIRLWTNGLHPPVFFESVKDAIDEVMLYLPSPDPDEFRRITGEDGFALWNQTIELLKELGIPLRLNFFVRPDNIDYLPYAHELAYEKRLPLLVHFDQTAAFRRDSVRFIRRYMRVPGVMVFADNRPLPAACVVFSRGAMTPWQVLGNWWYEKLGVFRNYLG